jgi:hypothetical protein
LRLRAVLHAGEIHDDGWGFYGEDLDIAFRLLDSPAVKKALKNAPRWPLVLVVSEEIYSAIVRQGYVNGGPYEQSVNVRVADRRRRGWVNIPVPALAERPLTISRVNTPLLSPTLAITPPPAPYEGATA